MQQDKRFKQQKVTSNNDIQNYYNNNDKKDNIGIS